HKRFWFSLSRFESWPGSSRGPLASSDWRGVFVWRSDRQCFSSADTIPGPPSSRAPPLLLPAGKTPQGDRSHEIHPYLLGGGPVARLCRAIGRRCHAVGGRSHPPCQPSRPVPRWRHFGV